MNKTTILVIGAADTTGKLAALLAEQPGWSTVTAAAGEPAIEKFHQQTFDAVVMDHTIDAMEEVKMRRIFSIQQPELVICKSNGTDDAALLHEISEGLKKASEASKPALVFTDDALKNAGLAITIQ